MKEIVSLFDESGNALRPWAKRGFICHAYDIKNTGFVFEDPSGGRIHYHHYDLLKRANVVQALRETLTKRPKVPGFIMSWPPCTHLARSGAAHFDAKLEEDPLIHKKAIWMARHAEFIGTKLGVPWFAENPVGILSSRWRKPDHLFDPCDYAGYLPEDDEHPRWPDYIAPRDRYNKRTCIWSGNGFVMPEFRHLPPIEKAWPALHKVGGKTARTKEIRSEGPRGFLEAVCLANLHHGKVW